MRAFRRGPGFPLSASACRGFTLIELVVALALLALLALLTTEVLRIGTRIWDSSRKLTDNLDELSVAQSVLRRTLGTMLPPYPGWPAAIGQVEGRVNAISFTSMAPVSQAGTWAHYRVYAKAGASASALMIAWQPIDSTNGAPSADWQQEMLIGDASEILFSYRPNGAPKADQWTSEWTDRDHTPALVRVSVHFSHGDRRNWPDLDIQPRITAPPNCRFDLVSRQCR